MPAEYLMNWNSWRCMAIDCRAILAVENRSQLVASYSAEAQTATMVTAHFEEESTTAAVTEASDTALVVEPC